MCLSLSYGICDCCILQHPFSAQSFADSPPPGTIPPGQIFSHSLSSASEAEEQFSGFIPESDSLEYQGCLVGITVTSQVVGVAW